MIIHSIKWRLQAWHGFLLVCLVSGLMSGFYVFERREKLQAIDNELAEAVTPLLPRYAPPNERGAGPRGPENRGPLNRDRFPPPPEDGDFPPPPEGGGPPPRQNGPRRAGQFAPPESPSPENDRREMQGFASGRLYYVAWTESGERAGASTNAPPDLSRPQPDAKYPGRFLRTRGDFRELAQFVPSGRSVLVGASLAPALAQLHKLAGALALIGGSIVLVGFAVGWWLATRALRPIAEISQTALEIAAGDLSKRINTSETESELGKLTSVLNSTFARLEAAFAQQQQFTSDAAHELRTPVSVVLTQIQSTLNKERTGTEYRETLEACQRAAQRMRRLIESLLELARFDAGQEKLKRIGFDLAHTAKDCTDLIQPLALEKRVKVITELSPANCAGDSERIGQVITNLLTNAVNYNKPDGEVRVTAAADNGSAVVTVADTGQGISAEDLPHVFERFYRADKARSNSLGSAGLGLSICKAIVEAHGGTIEAASRPGVGTTFTVRLPAS